KRYPDLLDRVRFESAVADIEHRVQGYISANGTRGKQRVKQSLLKQLDNMHQKATELSKEACHLYDQLHHEAGRAHQKIPFPINAQLTYACAYSTMIKSYTGYVHLHVK